MYEPYIFSNILKYCLVLLKRIAECKFSLPESCFLGHVFSPILLSSLSERDSKLRKCM